MQVWSWKLLKDKTGSEQEKNDQHRKSKLLCDLKFVEPYRVWPKEQSKSLHWSESRTKPSRMTVYPVPSSFTQCHFIFIYKVEVYITHFCWSVWRRRRKKAKSEGATSHQWRCVFSLNEFHLELVFRIKSRDRATETRSQIRAQFA